MTDELDLDAIEARAAAATPGPWLVGRDSPAKPEPRTIIDSEHYPIADMWWAADSPRSTTDATFIAAARTDVPALVAEVRRLKRLLTG